MIVAGAGIIGLSCAWRLSQAGVKVTVIDAGEAAREASWAGAGMLAPGGEIDSSADLAELAQRSLAQYPDFVRELAEESGVPIDFHSCGAFEVAFTESEYLALNARAERQALLGIQSETTEYRGLPARAYPADSIVDPRNVTKALLSTCRARGVRIVERELVVEILDSGEGVRTNRAEYRDTAVLIAAGAWSSALYPGLPRSEPVRGHLIGYHLPPGLLNSILRHEHTYLLQRGSGFLIAGSTTEHVGFNRAVDPHIAEQIHARACALLPILEDHPPDEAWIGFRPKIESEMPMIGRLPGTRVWTAFGHYRNGILLAPETARILAEAVTAPAANPIL